MDIILIIITLANTAIIGALVVMQKRSGAGHEGKDTVLRDEFALSRREFSEANKDLRQEVTAGITQTRESLDKRLEQ